MLKTMGDKINTFISHSKQQMYETLPARHELDPRKLGTLVSDLPRCGNGIHILLRDHLARSLMHESTIHDFTFTSLIYPT